ncbi:MAG: outer membrane protein transport protein [Calditrichia bacterium]
MFGQTPKSVYSMFGLGQMIDKNYGVNRALGGTGIAFQSGNTINYINPASYLGLNSSFVLELGLYGTVQKNSGSASAYSVGDINVSYFSTGINITDWWAFNFGFFPYSYVDYAVDTEEQIWGEPANVDKKYRGSGGINQINFGNAVRVNKNLSLGVNSIYLLGTITHTESAYTNSGQTSFDLSSENSVQDFVLEYGLQYAIRRKQIQYVLGIVYCNGKNLDVNEETLFLYNGTEEPLREDESTGYIIPQKIGIGFALHKDDLWKFGVDYEWRNWSELEALNKNVSFRNSHSFSIGTEYSIVRFNRKFDLRTGFKFENSYLSVDGSAVDIYRLNMGLGIPYSSKNSVNLAFEFGQEGFGDANRIKNTFWGFYLYFSLHEIWGGDARN